MTGSAEDTLAKSLESPAIPASDPSGAERTRRAILATGALGAVGLVAAACSSGNNSGSGTTTSAAPSTPAAPSTGGNSSAASSAGGPVITKVSNVPVGSGTLVKAAGTTWLVAAPKAGEIVCHSGICTHESCPLGEVVGERGICNCHGSEFNAFTGEVLRGPATRPLAKQSVTVQGENVVMGG